MPVPLPITVEALRAHLNMASTIHDAELTLHLTAATIAVEGRVGPVVARAFTGNHAAGNGVLVVTQRPLVSVQSVTAADGTAYLTADVRTHPAGLIFRDGPHCFWPGRYDVAYTAGRAEVPENLSVAVLIVAAHLWETQRGAMARGRTLGDMGDGGQATAMAMLRGFALPRRALELLQPDEPGVVLA